MLDSIRKLRSHSRTRIFRWIIGDSLCSNCGSVMRICCSNDACRNQNNIIPPEPTAVVAIAGFSSSGKSTYLLDVVASKSSETGVLVSAKSHALIEWREQNLHRIQQSDVLDSTQKHADNFSSVVGFQSVAKKTARRSSCR